MALQVLTSEYEDGVFSVICPNCGKTVTVKKVDDILRGRYCICKSFIVSFTTSGTSLLHVRNWAHDSVPRRFDFTGKIVSEVARYNHPTLGTIMIGAAWREIP